MSRSYANEEMQRCIFCGSNKVDAWVVNESNSCSKNHTEDWAVSCDECLAEGPWAKNREKAIELWNNPNFG